MWMNRWNSVFLETLRCPVITNTFRVCEKPAVRLFFFFSRQMGKSEVCSCTNTSSDLNQKADWGLTLGVYL